MSKSVDDITAMKWPDNGSDEFIKRLINALEEEYVSELSTLVGLCCFLAVRGMFEGMFGLVFVSTLMGVLLFRRAYKADKRKKAKKRKA